MKVTLKTTGIHRLHGVCVSHTRTDVKVRDQIVTADEPLERGGTNIAATPTETMLAALVACLNVILHAIAQKHGIELGEMTIDAEAVFDRRGVLLIEEVDVPFPEIRLTFNIRTNADDAAIELIKDQLPRHCAVSKVLRQAGTRIMEVWNVAH